MYIVLKSGEKIYGKDWKNAVRNLKNSSPFFTLTMKEYMEEMERIVWETHWALISSGGPEIFLKGLESLEILSIEK